MSKQRAFRNAMHWYVAALAFGCARREQECTFNSKSIRWTGASGSGGGGGDDDDDNCWLVVYALASALRHIRLCVCLSIYLLVVCEGVSLVGASLLCVRREYSCIESSPATTTTTTKRREIKGKEREAYACSLNERALPANFLSTY